MDPEEMPKVNIQKENLSIAQLHWMKTVEKKNLERAQRYKIVTRKNNITGCILALGVAAIYTYTIKSIKQETWFEDFELPETVSDDD